LKVFEHLNAWFEEFELYHRDNGKIAKERDDLLDATRYAIMSLQYARTKAKRLRTQDDYGWSDSDLSQGSGWAS
jgi:Terminase RNaseH-like domain